MFSRIETHAIASVPAAVANLNLDVAEVSAALINSFQILYGGRPVGRLLESELEESQLRPLIAKQRSRAWTYAATPKFTLEHNDLRLEVVKGMVAEARGAEAGRFINTAFDHTAFSLACDVD
jgi:hypothetical protein